MSAASGWDTAYEAAASAGGNRYLSIKAGEEYEVAFLGTPLVDKKVWDEKKRTYVAYNPEVHTKFSTKFLCNVVNRTQAGDEPVLQVFEFGVMVMDQLKKNFEKRSPEDWSFFISREGEGMNTEYGVVLGDQLTDDEKKAYADLELHDLEPELIKNKRAIDDSDASDDEDIPF